MSDLTDQDVDSAQENFFFSRDLGSKVISARGTEEGLVLRIDGRAEWTVVLEELSQFLEARRHFLSGGELSLEWLDRMPTKEQSQELAKKLREEYQVEIVGRRKRPEAALSVGDKHDAQGKNKATTIPLFENIEDAVRLSKQKAGNRKTLPQERASSDAGVEANSLFTLGSKDASGKQLSKMTEILGESVFYDEEANAKVVFGTLRSGQRIETPFSLLVVGDVNPGADVVAGGDIVIFGNLRGTAHASAYNDEGSDRVIIAMQMKPMQLRIGSVISRGSEESVEGAEIARIEDRRIIVEAFNPRMLLRRAGK